MVYVLESQLKKAEPKFRDSRLAHGEVRAV